MRISDWSSDVCSSDLQLSNAILWLNRIRFRSGMPAITETSQVALRARYRHERRIEMAYEEHRYHDTRRWMIAKETLGRDLTYKIGRASCRERVWQYV